MKITACILFASLVFAGCQNSKQERQIKELSSQDSVLLQKTQEKDSTIMAYIHSLNDIEDNINDIKRKENIISMSGKKEGNNSESGSIVADIKGLDALIVKNHKEIIALEKKLQNTNKRDVEIKRMITNLTAELSDKETQIADLEVKLARANDTIRLIVAQFNDSMIVIGRQRMEITAMKTEINSVYYAFGTYKELKKQGVLTKLGTVMGVGGMPTLKQDFNTSYFTSATMNDLHAIPLYAKFQKLVTNHPTDSYKVTGNGKADYFVITDPALFWSTSKYLVIIVNEVEINKNVVPDGQVSLSQSVQ
jgi:hypothetical protein